jgi:hypothetical protein
LGSEAVSSQGYAFNAFEPGFNPSTGLGTRDQRLHTPLAEIRTPAARALYEVLEQPEARLVTKILINESCQTGLYYDDGRRPMLGSALVCDRSSRIGVVAGSPAK